MNLVNIVKKLLTRLNYSFESYCSKEREALIQHKCKHEKWDCDTQIRTIECKGCGKRAWIDDYRDLYGGYQHKRSLKYDSTKYSPPFRVGRKQGLAVLDSKGLLVVVFAGPKDLNQAGMYVDYLNS